MEVLNYRNRASRDVRCVPEVSVMRSWRIVVCVPGVSMIGSRSAVIRSGSVVIRSRSVERWGKRSDWARRLNHFRSWRLKCGSITPS